MPTQPSNSGIVTDETGERHIPESMRADGSVRKAIKVRPGYRPPEDVELYKNRTAETFRNRYKGGVIGADMADDDDNETAPSSAAANKNAKRREARKKAKAAEAGGQQQNGGDENDEEDHHPAAAPNKKKPVAATAAAAAPEETADPDAEREKKARNLKKKLKQARELKDKKEGGQALLPEQIAKVIKINELVRELAALGLDGEGEPVVTKNKEEDEGNVEGSTTNQRKEEAPA